MCINFGEKQNKCTKNKHKRIRKIRVLGHKQYSQSIMASVSAHSTVVTLILPLSPNYCFLSEGVEESVPKGIQRESQEPGTKLKEMFYISCRQPLMLRGTCQACGCQLPPSSFLTFREPRDTNCRAQAAPSPLPPSHASLLLCWGATCPNGSRKPEILASHFRAALPRSLSSLLSRGRAGASCVLLVRSQLPDKPFHPRILAWESSLCHGAIEVVIIVMRPASLSWKDSLDLNITPNYSAF